MVYKYNQINSSASTTDYDAMVIIYKYADSFVRYARYFFKDSTGSEKMQLVINHIKIIAERYNVSISTEEIKAIVQRAYELMIESSNNNTNISIDAIPITPTPIGDTVNMVSSTNENIALLDDDTKIIKEP
jgi:hypothetical protein